MAKFDVATEKGVSSFDSFIASKSYVEGWSFSDVDTELFGKFTSSPDASKTPNAYRWFIHIAALTGKSIAAPTPVPVEAVAAPAAPAAAPVAAPAPAPVPAVKEEAPAVAAEADDQERRLVAIMVKPCAGVDPQGLYKKIKETVVSQPEYKIKWDETCKVEDGKIYASFTIGLEADFDEEVMEVIEYMEGEVADQQITYQAAME
eukprot:CAMPEP_0198145558 /NCGR_PEP_ID=MMETSP1443-20131203/24321_1 /TAXON_ID=186043 /ORGANISM="Entomoneis sp., Strain CCMP2396" /LENGTH=203 /DNA_ID=CAMNT_0043809245 /DNA_START=63 /DNA_END=674 /DNA_ORIENTATION=-